jgi:uncharacterized damage-inducible protein DinB
MPEPETRAAVAAGQLTATTDQILAEVLLLPPELIHRVPAAGVWTVMDNLCHIREFVPFWTAETLRIVQRPTEQWGRDHTDTARLAAVANTAAHTLEDVVSDIRDAVRRSAETLKALSEEDLAAEATSRNPRWGVKPASFVVDELLVRHVAKHQGQIRRNISQFNEGRPRA